MRTATGMAMSAAGLLLLATACGGGGNGDQPALSKAELGKAAVTGKNLPGYKVTVGSAPGGSRTKADNAKCQPILDGTAPAGSQKVKTSTRRDLSKAHPQTESGDGNSYSVVLAAFTESDAKKAMSDLRDALKACGSGFTTPTESLLQETTGVRQKKATGGDEAIGVLLEGPSWKLNYVIARQGSTLVSIGAADSAFVKAVDVPPEIVDKQTEKIAEVAG
ncbi:hypothetical protein [Streptomyces sp. NPDC005336]|uniref:hypothetical protein n=1 Tax=Streptomyces sp. NPDC005336 TaxID=3157035 RepID=UPI0033BE6759